MVLALEVVPAADQAPVAQGHRVQDLRGQAAAADQAAQDQDQAARGQDQAAQDQDLAVQDQDQVPVAAADQVPVAAGLAREQVVAAVVPAEADQAVVQAEAAVVQADLHQDRNANFNGSNK